MEISSLKTIMGSAVSEEPSFRQSERLS